MVENKHQTGSGQSEELITERESQSFQPQDCRVQGSQRVSEQQFNNDLTEESNSSDRSGRLKDRRGKLLFEMCVSRRYCSKRESYFIMLDKWTTFINLLGGSAVMADLAKIGTLQSAIEDWHLAFFGSATVLIASLSSLIFEWRDRARHYSSQKRGYIALIEQFYRLGEAMTQEQLNQMRADFTVMEADESEPKTRLATICRNDELSYRNLRKRRVAVCEFMPNVFD